MLVLFAVVVSIPPLVRPGQAPPSLTVAAAPTLAPQISGQEVCRPTGSSQRDIGVSVVCMCWHEMRWVVLCVCALQSGHIGVRCVSGEIL